MKPTDTRLRAVLDKEERNARRRCEYIQGSHAKFWTLDRSGKKVTTTWGRIGTAGQARTQDSPAVAARATQDLANGGVRRDGLVGLAAVTPT